MTKKAVLLINLGTPDHCDPASVRRYLKEFLNDPRVIDLPAVLRWPLVNGVIIPFRYKKSAAAYQKIWQDNGSPLLVNSEQLRAAVAAELGEGYEVALAMRYGNPSIASAFEQLKECETIFVLPLFPQYSAAANGSAIEQSLQHLSKRWNTPSIHLTHDFYEHTGFIDAFAQQIAEQIEEQSPEFILFSYHGLPKRHLHKSQCRSLCEAETPCPVITSNNRFCYRAQCYATTQAIANQLKLSPTQYKVSFQSRLGRTPWIMPYTDFVLPELREQGIKRLAVVSPSFVADCLETVEEINIRTREQWMSLGGESFTYIPCINASPIWVKAVAQMAREAI